MATSYTYTISGDFTNASQVNINTLQIDVTNDATVSVDLDYITHSGDDITIQFPSALSAGQKTGLDDLISAYTYVAIPPPTVSPEYQAVVSQDVNYPGDYTTIGAAFSAGKISVFVRSGTYVETSDINIPDRGKIMGETNGQVIVVLAAGCSLRADGSGGTKEVNGTISITHNTTAVTGSGTTFTNLSVGNFILIGNSYFQIDTITNDTSLDLVDTYAGKTVSGHTYIAQAMLTGVYIENLIIANSSDVGLYLRGLRHGAAINVAIIGCTPNMQMVDCGDCSFRTIISSSGTGIGVTFENCVDIIIDTANVYNNTTQGIVVRGTCSNILLDSCSCTCNTSHGICIEDTSKSISLTDCIIKQNNGKGVHTTTSTTHIVADSCFSSDNNSDGISLVGTGNIISDCIINDNGGSGIICSTNSILQGNQCVSNTTHGIDMIDSNTCIIGGNICSSNSSDGINCTGDNNNIFGNICKSNTGSGVEITSAGNNNIVTGNQLSGNTGTNLVDSGTGTVTANNISS